MYAISQNQKEQALSEHLLFIYVIYIYICITCNVHIRNHTHKIYDGIKVNVIRRSLFSPSMPCLRGWLTPLLLRQKLVEDTHYMSPCCGLFSVAQLYPILCDAMDDSLPGSSVLIILQARLLEWVAISFSRD